MPQVVLCGSHVLGTEVPPDDPGEANAPPSKVQLEHGISPAARLYALQQLAHRAAIPHELLNSWKGEANNDATVLKLGGDARIRFRHAPPTFWHELVKWDYHMMRAARPYPPLSPLSGLVRK